MERHASLLLDVWREVCRHIEIGESIERLGPILMRRLPIDTILIRRLDPARSCVETVATGHCRPDAGGDLAIGTVRTEPVGGRAGAIGGVVRPEARCFAVRTGSSVGDCRGCCPRGWRGRSWPARSSYRTRRGRPAPDRLAATRAARRTHRPRAGAARAVRGGPGERPPAARAGLAPRGARGGQDVAPLATGPARYQRLDRRRRHRAEAGDGSDRAGGAFGYTGPDPGRDGGGQGGRGAGHPRAVAAGGRAVPAGQLRCHPARPGRLGAVRPRAGQFHRRGRDAARVGSSGPTAARSSSTSAAS